MVNLKKIRCQKKLTQNGLARKSGLSQSYINELENGKKVNPSVIVLAKLSDALDVALAELLDEEITA